VQRIVQRKFLFIHQNFPGQFVHVAKAMVAEGHQVVALAINGRSIPGVNFIRYNPARPDRESAVFLARDFEPKIVRGNACALEMQKLKSGGFSPDTVIAHPGWGEALFCKDIWPVAKLVVFAEFFYSSASADYNFDPEFARDELDDRMRLRLKNSVHLHALHDADAIYSPTHWQKHQLPAIYQPKVSVIFDGIDTAIAKPNPRATIHLKRDNIKLSAGDEVITFVNRNLEPYRGFHVFMRALPAILRQRPKAHCLIVGGDDVSYGNRPRNAKSWRDVMLNEVGHALPMDRVHFLGNLTYSDYLRVLQVSRCHVYLTYPFVLSWSCLEAMSVGCTLVASDTGPVKEVINHEKNGLLVDFFDIKKIVNLTIDALATPKSYQAMRSNARETVLDRYDLKDKCLPELVALLR
jgi:glycosyltransferase involved in cell wall biosynthesis